MPERSSFDYAVIRVVPRVERGESINAGVILFCLEKDFLKAKIEVDEPRLRALWPEIDMDLVRRHLEAIPKICDGIPDAGPIGRLSLRERFHWLVAPRSTIIQISPVHAGLCDHPERAIEDLFEKAVRLP
ncbi:MAG TPA: DUF3037 domain-containing protein [Thermoanaerobaculia bacterium]|jgi:hypothetical protein|nr:DUF3037 domain-containing protein [Thermoanaerobaculia bacterium]